MSEPSNEARDEIVSQEVAHEEFAAQHRHEPKDRPSTLDEKTLEKLEEPS